MLMNFIHVPQEKKGKNMKMSGNRGLGKKLRFAQKKLQSLMISGECGKSFKLCFF